ncbi:MAG TPA: hypothetical protein VH592_06630 [Gemmataceae bacterium]|jgi:hypothetical protein
MFGSFSSVQPCKTLKIVCEAPAYEIVKASGSVGMRSPEDVCWRRQAMPKGETPKQKSLAGRIWQLLFAFCLPEVQETCGCGRPLPERRFVFLRKRSGAKIRYALTQCSRCHTILWDEERTAGAHHPTG